LPATIEMSDTRRGYSARRRRQEIIHDRKIVHCKVPHYVDIGLKQTQIHANRIVIAAIAKFARIEQVFDLAHSSRIKEGVVNREH
jgi:hypothetical protein